MRVWRSSHAVNQWWIQLNERQRVLHMRQHKVPLYFTRGNKVVYGYTWKQIAAILRIVNKMKVIVDWIRLQTESVCCWWTVVFLWWDCIFRVSVLVAAMPSVMERSGAGVLSRSRAKTVTNGNSQPHSEEESSDEEHAHGRHTHTHTLNWHIIHWLHLNLIPHYVEVDLSTSCLGLHFYHEACRTVLAVDTQNVLPAVLVAFVALLQCFFSPLCDALLCHLLLPSSTPFPHSSILIILCPHTSFLPHSLLHPLTCCWSSFFSCYLTRLMGWDKSWDQTQQFKLTTQISSVNLALRLNISSHHS